MKLAKYLQQWFFMGGIAAITLLIAGTVYLVFVFKNLPNPALFDQRQVAQSTKIYDRTGTVLLYELYNEQKRTTISFEEIPDIVKQATIVVEDKNFYSHAAIDVKSIIRAFITNIIHGRIVQGGSTITQQLAKNAFLKPDKTITRKLRELAIAYRLEHKYTKDEILNLYLNQIPYGSNAYGISAATQTYFGKKPIDLTPGEVAILVSLPKAPSYYSPWGNHVDELMARKDRALDQMLASEIITPAEFRAAKETQVALLPQATDIKAPHFAIYIQEYLIKTYGEEFVRTAGLSVTTTLDWNLQQHAEKFVAEGAERNEALYKGTNAALVAQDSTTGQVLAMVGSRNYFDEKIGGNFNVAAQGLRQPGSSIKPFGYLTAFMKGYTPDTVLFDLPTDFNASGDPSRSYAPQNFDEEFRGPVTMRTGLAQSINIPSVKTLYLAGIDAMLKNAHAMGITTLNERSRYGLSLALGGGEVTLLDMVGAYSVFSQDGLRHEQVFILEIKDARGNILEEYKDRTEQVVEPQYIRIINDILSDTEARSGLFHNSLNLTVFPNQEVAIKTGTTNDYRDAWTMGYTRSLVVGVWAGNNDNKPMQRKGGSILAAVPIWNAFMKEALKDRPLEIFPRPEPIVVEKPILNNQYVINNEVHTILYYIDKNDPQGAPPTNPRRDSQFENWERPILQWLGQNNSLLGQGADVANAAGGSLEINSPRNGEFVTNPLTITASITSQNDIVKVETYINEYLTNQQLLPPTKQYLYQIIVAAPLATQNKITIKAFDNRGNAIARDVIVFTR